MSTGTDKQSRKASITIADLEAIHENDLYEMHHPKAAAKASPAELKFLEHSEIFKEICHEAEHLDSHVNNNSNNSNSNNSSNSQSINRRGSLTGCADDMALPPPLDGGEFRTLHRRRHSSYESTMRATHREQHQEVKEHIARLECKHHLKRSNFIDSLLEFNLSVDVSSMADLGASSSAAMQLSCPVLSYMNDDEEDSIELRQIKRPSLVSVMEDPNDDAQQNWETLKGGPSNFQQPNEYEFELPPLAPEEPKKMRPKRRRHSYKILEEKFSEQSPYNVLKGWNSTGNDLEMAPRAAAAAPPKSLELQNGMNEFQRAREGPMRTKMQCARGA